jgi:hypothetical protein
MSDNDTVIGFFLVVILIVFITQCGTNPNMGKQSKTETGITYTEFTINGMPCVYVEKGLGNSKTGGPSCDWSKR